jgi:hypothetical protein
MKKFLVFWGVGFLRFRQEVEAENELEAIQKTIEANPTAKIRKVLEDRPYTDEELQNLYK